MTKTRKKPKSSESVKKKIEKIQDEIEEIEIVEDIVDPPEPEIKEEKETVVKNSENRLSKYFKTGKDFKHLVESISAHFKTKDWLKSYGIYFPKHLFSEFTATYLYKGSITNTVGILRRTSGQIYSGELKRELIKTFPELGEYFT